MVTIKRGEVYEYTALGCTQEVIVRRVSTDGQWADVCGRGFSPGRWMQYGWRVRTERLEKNLHNRDACEHCRSGSPIDD